MAELDPAEQRWHAWIEEACAAVGVDPEHVAVRPILALTKTIAHEFERPMAPVGAYILGLAAGQRGTTKDLDTLVADLEATTGGRHGS